MKSFFRYLLAVAILTAAGAWGQVSVGTPAFGSFGGGPFDIVNLGSLNVHFAIPVLHKAGRGIPFAYDLSYDSSVWTPKTSNGSTQWSPDSNWGWRGLTEAAVGYVYQTATNTLCKYPVGNGRYNQYYYWVWWLYGYGDHLGVFHPIKPIYTDSDSAQNCGVFIQTGSGPATDGSGYTLSVTSGKVVTVTTIAGQTISAPVSRNAPSSGSITDANGNQITTGGTQFFDTLSSTTPVLWISSPAPPAATTFTYAPPSNAASSCNPITQCASYTMNFLPYTVKTNFGVSNASGPISEYGPITNYLVSGIVLPDGTSYSFTYELTGGTCTPNQGTQSSCVTGRIASIMLPTLGQISYTYSGGTNNTGIYSDGSTAGLSRALSPNTCSSGGCWQYARTLVTGTPGTTSTWTTTVTDPNGDQTIINFSEGLNNNFYETQRVVNWLIGGTQTPQATITTCYNGNYINCANTNVTSLAVISVYTALPNGKTRLSETAVSGGDGNR
jgi:hypothetical protein